MRPQTAPLPTRLAALSTRRGAGGSERPARIFRVLAPTLLVLVAASLSPNRAAGQSVAGRVVEVEGETPIPMATVSLVDEEGRVIAEASTDDAGRFHFTDLSQGRYRLRVAAFGFTATGEVELEVDRAPVMVRLLVQPAPVATEGIRVTVQRRDSRFRNTRQVISGKVLDARSAEPVGAMEVLVRNVRGEEVGRTLSDEEGRFFFVVSDAGLYRLAVAGFGYDSTATANVAVAPDQDLYLELEVQPAAFGLAPITVTAPRTIPYLESTGFYGRMRRGQGTYMTPKDLDRMPGAFPSQLLRRVAGLSVRHDGTIEIRGVTGFMGGPCAPNIILDGMPMGRSSVDDLITMSAIDAIEVYKGAATVPPQWRTGATCGVIAIWTKH